MKASPDVPHTRLVADVSLWSANLANLKGEFNLSV
jgi:hypothetical protein